MANSPPIWLVKQSKTCEKNAKAKLYDVDCIIVATTTADLAFPSVACQIQSHFGIVNAAAFDLNATCAGFTYGLHLANSLIRSGAHKKVLVIATETLSKVTDYTDRSTCILFGDGAGAMLVEADQEKSSFLSVYMGTDGEGGEHVYRAGLSATLNGNALNENRKMVQNGREVYKWVVRTIPLGIEKLLKQARMTVNDLNWFVPHSANLRMIESLCEKSGIPEEKLLASMEYYGNTSSSSIPLALDLALTAGKIKKNDTLLLYGFGGGLTHLGLIVEWNI